MLRKYQKECLEACLQHPEGGLNILPTGSGKSHIIGALCEYFDPKEVLVITPRVELMRQNKEKIKNKTLCVTINKAYHSAIYRKILIVDEAHLVRPHDGMYKTIISHATVVYGFTATPFRLGYGNITPIFKKLIYEIDRNSLIRDGFLTKRKIITIPGNLLINVKTSMFSNTHSLSKVACPKSEKCLQHYLKSKPYDQALIFTCDIEHAGRVKNILTTCNKTNGVIHSQLPKQERTTMVKRFKMKDIQFMINCEILTTGFDYPALENIIILRPTNSYTLYEQICGRGDRIYKGKKYNNIYDYTLNSFNFDFINEKKQDPFRYCLFCCCKTDYRLSVCTHCGKSLIKTDISKKSCKKCTAENCIAAVYCWDCGTFMRENVRVLSFSHILFNSFKNNSYCYFGKKSPRFYYNYEQIKKIVDTLSKTKLKVKKTKNVYWIGGFKVHTIYWKYDNYKKKSIILKISKKVLD